MTHSSCAVNSEKSWLSRTARPEYASTDVYTTRGFGSSLAVHVYVTKLARIPASFPESLERPAPMTALYLRSL